MGAVRILDYQRSAPLFRHLPDEKVAWIHKNADEVNHESGVVSACQSGLTHGLEVRLPVDGSGSPAAPGRRNLRAETST